ncbi:hypothetical protein AAY473_010647 [Plecturocebus cupreus]
MEEESIRQTHICLLHSFLHSADGVLLCCPDWSAVVQSWITAISPPRFKRFSYLSLPSSLWGPEPWVLSAPGPYFAQSHHYNKSTSTVYVNIIHHSGNCLRLFTHFVSLKQSLALMGHSRSADIQLKDALIDGPSDPLLLFHIWAGCHQNPEVFAMGHPTEKKAP